MYALGSVDHLLLGLDRNMLLDAPRVELPASKDEGRPLCGGPLVRPTPSRHGEGICRNLRIARGGACPGKQKVPKK